jgi:hypothetical protein
MILPVRTPEEPHLVVLYKIQKAGQEYYGLIPKSELQLFEGGVRFAPRGYGTYQAARTPVLVNDRREQASFGDDIWTFAPKLTLTTLGQPFDFDLLDGSLFVTSDQQLEYFPAGQTTSRLLDSEPGIRRLVITQSNVYTAVSTLGLGYILGLQSDGTRYTGDLRSLPAGNSGAFEIGVGQANDGTLVLLHDAIETGFSGRISFFNANITGPNALTSSSLATLGNRRFSYSGSNGSTRVGDLLVRPNRIYALLRDGLHTVERIAPTVLGPNSLIEGTIDQAFCLAPGTLPHVVYVGHKSSRIAVLSAENNQGPKVVRDVEAGETILSLVVHKNFLYALTSSARLLRFDMTDPLQPFRVGPALELGLGAGKPLRMKSLAGLLYIGFEGRQIVALSL